MFFAADFLFYDTFFFSPDAEFVGYTVPHPAENKMHFRIQAKQGRAADLLRRGLEDLEKVCDHVLETFEEKVQIFQAKSQGL